MSYNKLIRSKKDRLVAKVIEEESSDSGNCAFCHRNVNNEVLYGKLYSIGDLYCHYFCVLLSCCLVQKGVDDEGLLGFLYTDIVAEVERSKKHRCSYCSRGGATLGCAVAACRKQFHVPCGHERNAMSMFFGNYKSFCQQHAPKQKIDSNIMEKAQARKALHMKMNRVKPNSDSITNVSSHESIESGTCSLDDSEDSLCVLCYAPVPRWPSPAVFCLPCCATDKWLHRECLQRMALSAGMHYLKCPLCNDKMNFYKAVVSQGYYVPDRDAAWELEQNAFAEMYTRKLRCDVTPCHCPTGRDHDEETGEWDIQLCLLCGSSGAHRACWGAGGSAGGGEKSHRGGEGGGGGAGGAEGGARFVCGDCRAATAAGDWEKLGDALEAMIQTEQNQVQTNQSSNHGPPMPARMSIRRTKGRIFNPPVGKIDRIEVRQKEQSDDQTTTSNEDTTISTEMTVRRTTRRIMSDRDTEHTFADPKSTTESSRQDLNLKTPRHPKPIQKSIQTQNPQLSPMKMLENELFEKISSMNVVIDAEMIEGLRLRLAKPQPLSGKKRIVNGILNEIFNRARGTPSPNKGKSIAANIQNAEEGLSTVKTTPKMKTPIKKSLSLKKKQIFNEHNESNSIENVKISSIDGIHDIVHTTDKNGGENGNIGKISIKNELTTNIVHLTVTDIVEKVVEEKITIKKEEPYQKLPKKSTKVDIEKDSSFEISENDESVKIDLVTIESIDSSNVINDLVVKSPEKKLCVKFNPGDKENLQDKVNVVNLECFKNQYLNEVERETKQNNEINKKAATCNFSHKHEIKEYREKNGTAIDFPMEVASTKTKKKKKKSKNKNRKSPKIKLVYVKDNTLSKAERRKLKKKKKKNMSLTNGSDLSVEINWREEEVNIKINKKERKRKHSECNRNFKQTVLNFSPESCKKEFSENDATPAKRKKDKHDKPQDSWKQTSIQSFFKAFKSPNK